MSRVSVTHCCLLFMYRSVSVLCVQFSAVDLRSLRPLDDHGLDDVGLLSLDGATLSAFDDTFPAQHSTEMEVKLSSNESLFACSERERPIFKSGSIPNK